MNIQRRLLLKGMALSGISGLVLGKSGMVLANASIGSAESMPILLLINEETKHSVFYQGVRAAAGQGALQMCITDPGTNFFSLLQNNIRSEQGRRIVGLVDDASATLIVDLARTAGARMHWLGQHAVVPGQSRHRLSDSRITSSYGTLFGSRLAAHGFSIDSDDQWAVKKGAVYESVSYVRNGIPDGQQWAADLGFILAGNGYQTTLSVIPQVSTKPAPLTGHFVSFAFEI